MVKSDNKWQSADPNDLVFLMRMWFACYRLYPILTSARSISLVEIEISIYKLSFMFSLRRIPIFLIEFIL